jgi:hypothetical protein
MRSIPLFAFALAALPGAAVFAAAEGPSPPPFRLAWPVACRLGTDCEIQHYIDRDPSPAARDYACGTRTYDGHDGVDIRLPDMAAQRRGVAVLAAAAGRVLRVRDGMADVSVRTTGAGAVKDVECGNGLVIAHAGGFETQYCHMAKGSLLVKPGDTVKAGTPLGRIGLSGDTEFPHLHFTVRKDGKVADPFAYGAPAGACGGGRSLWARTPAYEARVVVNAGFADAAPTLDSVVGGELHPPAAAAGALIAYVRAIGLKAGDVQAMVLRAPDGSVMVQQKAEPLPRNQDVRLMFIGKRRPARGWAKGRYQASYTVAGADGKVTLSRSFGLTL